MIKSYLSRFMSKEQFGFLNDRQILNAIGIFHEVMHSIHIKDLEALMLKMDLTIESIGVI